MSEIVIGKHTLESLTSGMYANPSVVFREYVQNAADSIDDAVKAGLMTQSDSKIEIKLLPAERQIVIFDNGLGIPSQIAERTLVSIGNSKKSAETARGFRGIGRLSALSYCTALTFETSAFSESKGTRVSFNARKLSELLSSQEKTDITAVDVINDVYSIEFYPEKESAHYFRATLNGVDESSGLNCFEDVKEYLSQNLPVAYDYTIFSWGKEIERRLQSQGYCIPLYNVFLTYAGVSHPIYKTYKDEFIVDKGKNITDKIRDIEVFSLSKADGDITAIGWIAKTSYLGSIYDKLIKGIRLRKGNILIGDNQTLNTVFKDARFNGWSIGEVFVIDPKLVPNARRDNFEKNASYFSMFEQLTAVSSEISKEIRSASLKRNSEISNVVIHANAVSAKANAAFEAGLSANQRGYVTNSLVNVKNDVLNATACDETGTIYQSIAFEELDMLIGKVQGATKYKALNSVGTLNKVEKKILEKVFDSLETADKEHADMLIEAILADFCTKK